jgi:hypothetical protein
LRCLLADHALGLHGEIIAEERLRKSLAPDLGLEHARHLERAVRALEGAVGLDGAQARLGGQQLSTAVSKRRESEP